MRLLPTTLLDELAARAATSPRRRAHFNVHATPTDPVQRFFVVAHRDAYFRPHRHSTRSEFGLLVRGSYEIVTFDDHGVVIARHGIGTTDGTFGAETPSGVWHTLVVGNDGCVFFEVKEGPYDPATAAEFAPWAPPEGDSAVPAFLDWVRTAQPGARAR